MNRKLIATALGAVMALSFTGCGDDDEEGGAGAATTAKATDIDGAGVRLLKGAAVSYTGSSVRESTFAYNEDGSLKTQDGVDFAVFCAEVGAEFNSQGYLSRTAFSDENDYETSAFDYDGDGHLTRCYMTEEWEEEGEKGYWSSEVKFTWKNGLLTTIRCEEDGSLYYETSIEYSDVDNKHLQPAFVDGDWEPTQPFVLMGKGPKKLPSEIRYVEYYNGKKQYDRTLKVSFAVDTEGLIKSCTAGGKTYQYTYTK